MKSKNQNNNGIYIGVEENASPVILRDTKKSNNFKSNYPIFAKAGEGMSFRCKLQALDILNNNPNTIVIDPKGEIQDLISEKLKKYL